MDDSPFHTPPTNAPRTITGPTFHGPQFGPRPERLAVLEELRTRLAGLRNDLGRIDLTDSSKRQEVYELVRRAEGIGPT